MTDFTPSITDQDGHLASLIKTARENERLLALNDDLKFQVDSWRDAHALLHKAHRDALAEIERLKAQTIDTAPIARLTVDDSGLVVRTGLYAPGLPPGEHDVWPVPVDAAAEIEALRAEVERLRARCRETAQTLIAAVGADGPMNCEEAARRAVARIAELERALAFYAEGKHYAGLDEWDTVSGEGSNWLFPVHREDDQAQIEDGWIARATLAGEEIDWSEADG